MSGKVVSYVCLTPDCWRPTEAVYCCQPCGDSRANLGKLGLPIHADECTEEGSYD